MSRLAMHVAAAAVTAAATLSLAPALHAQGLYTPRAIKEAYVRHTRSYDGRPGAAYWQNHGRYTIDITATPPDRTIRGTERIVYHNNSPDSLRSLVFKLFINIHRPGTPRLGGAAPDFLNAGLSVDSFAINGAATPWRGRPTTGTWLPVRLPKALAPHDSVDLSVAWHYEISKEAGREGMLDSTTYYLAYFYPRVAVYDDYNGWDQMNFTGMQEFYSDFNDYDVTLHVPANWVVWGTGTLTNAGEVLQPAALARYQASLTSDSVIHVATHAQMTGHEVTVQQPMNAWHFTATNVPDMTFALSDHYDWDAASVTVDATPRRVSVQSAFNDTASDFHSMVRFGQHAIGWLSRNWPGVPYPYEKSTIVQGSADMEYPMMVNDGSVDDTNFAKLVVEHEIAHTWMPFYMGINETRYPFMDEGWATTFEYLIGLDDVGPARAAEFYRQFRVSRWIHDPSPLEDLPIVTPADGLTGGAYGNNAYGKASLGYLAMKDLLGDALFRKCLHAYMDRWHGKHPIPWDFFYTFNDVSGRDLDWFWKSWYFSNNYIDIALTGVRRVAGGYEVRLANIGGMPAPVGITVTYANGDTATFHQTPAIWQKDQQHTTVRLRTAKAIRSLTLDHGIWMDADVTNDSWSARK